MPPNAIGCGPNGARPVRIPEMPPTLYDDLLAVVAGRGDKTDEELAKSLVTVIRMYAVADQTWETEAGRLRGQLEAESAYQGLLRDERDHLAGQVERVREVMAWARQRNEELLANRDRLGTDQRAQRKSWEWSAAEVRGLANQLSKALAGGGHV